MPRSYAPLPGHQETAGGPQDHVLLIVPACIDRLAANRRHHDWIGIAADRPRHVYGPIDRARAGEPTIDNVYSTRLQNTVNNSVKVGQGSIGNESRRAVSGIIQGGRRHDADTRYLLDLLRVASQVADERCELKRAAGIYGQAN